MVRRLYFDHAATTPMSEVALESLSAQARRLGNPSSLHHFGQAVRSDLEGARERISRAIGSKPSEIIFTGSGTEANNAAIKGLYWIRSPRKIIITTAIEHHAVHDPIHWLAEHDGATIIETPLHQDGSLRIPELEKIVDDNREEIALIALIHTNNEIGTSLRQDEMEAISKIAGDIPIHLDAIQSIGKVEFNFQTTGATSAAISGHKVGGPLGVGALLLKQEVEITPLLHGGGQEREIRSGTLNTPGIVAFASAITESIENLPAKREHLFALREKFIANVTDALPGARVNGRGDAPGIINITLPGTNNEASLLLFDSEGIACSTGSACSQGLAQPSHVLLALGLSEKDVRASLRFSLAPSTTVAEIDEFSSVLPTILDRALAVGAKTIPLGAQ